MLHRDNTINISATSRNN